MLKSAFNFCCRVFFLLLFVVKSKINSGSSLYVFDIDNTIGNTYPTLQKKYGSEKERLLSIPVFPKIKSVVQQLLKSESRKVIFLTARSYKTWSVTHEWLSKNDINASLSDVIIVSAPQQKIEFLQTILPRNKRVVFVDDMSWNHENGEVKFYENEIRILSGLPLRHIGYSTIQRHQTKI